MQSASLRVASFAPFIVPPQRLAAGSLFGIGRSAGHDPGGSFRIGRVHRIR